MGFCWIAYLSLHHLSCVPSSPTPHGPLLPLQSFALWVQQKEEAKRGAMEAEEAERRKRGAATGAPLAAATGDGLHYAALCFTLCCAPSRAVLTAVLRRTGAATTSASAFPHRTIKHRTALHH